MKPVFTQQAREAASPTPQALRALREHAGLTQQQAADLVHAGLRTYHRWESGQQPVPPAEFELLQIKVAGRKLADRGGRAAGE